MRVEPWRDHAVPGEEWRLDAACRDTDPETFYPEGLSSYPAKRICERCDVKAECLDYSVRNRERFGVWGGLGEQERRPLMGYVSKPKRTECVNGHSWLLPDSYYTRPDGVRVCKECNRQRKRERAHRQGRAA